MVSPEKTRSHFSWTFGNRINYFSIDFSNTMFSLRSAKDYFTRFHKMNRPLAVMLLFIVLCFSFFSLLSSLTPVPDWCLCVSEWLSFSQLYFFECFSKQRKYERRRRRRSNKKVAHKNVICRCTVTSLNNFRL